MNVEETLPLFALMVKTRHEKYIAAALSGKGYKGYVPLQRQLREYSGRRRTVDLPVFPGYVFARFDPHIRLPVLTIPGVFSIVGNHAGPLAVDEGEFASVWLACKSAMDMEEHPFGEPGRRVIVIDGPLTGVTGTIITRKNRTRLILSITIMQRAMSVEVDVRTVMPADDLRVPGTPRREASSCRIQQKTIRVA
jgi:transcription antitermination factor NusG